jgi:hypothetical protein
LGCKMDEIQWITVEYSGRNTASGPTGSFLPLNKITDERVVTNLVL